MDEDPLRYEQLIEDALRGVVRRAIDIAAERGLPNDHHFHITFRTDHPGVDIPEPLQRQYPTEMTIVLQHMFWDLAVHDDRFEVTLAFRSVRHRLVVPFAAVQVFQDQSVGFVLQFQAADGANESTAEKKAGPVAETDPSAVGADDGATPGTPIAADEDGNVVPLDSFRKK